jgi:predicted ATPase
MLTKVTVSNYKSIASCEVHLGPLTFLVGLNGSGKSNFIDAIKFCRDALTAPLNQAFAIRGSTVYRVSSLNDGAPRGFALRFDLLLPGGDSAHYSFSIAPEAQRPFGVRQEECVVKDAMGRIKDAFKRRGSSVSGAKFAERLEATDRLHLLKASSDLPFRHVFDALEGMEFYEPVLEMIKAPELSSSTDVLESHGSNIASVFEKIGREYPDTKSRIEDYLRQILPGLRDVAVETVDAYKYLRFEQDLQEGGSRTFTASGMSDGTLRAMAILVALFQRSIVNSKPSLVVIEEPETGLHPAATEALLDALREGAMLGQVLVTSHSPELLDNREIPSDSILAVDASLGASRIGPLDSVGRSTLRDHLYTAGELLRMDQLKPVLADAASELVLFEPDPQCSD